MAMVSKQKYTGTHKFFITNRIDSMNMLPSVDRENGKKTKKLSVLYEKLIQKKNPKIVAHQADSDVLMVQELLVENFKDDEALIEEIEKQQQVTALKDKAEVVHYCRCTKGI